MQIGLALKRNGNFEIDPEKTDKALQGARIRTFSLGAEKSNYVLVEMPDAPQPKVAPAKTPAKNVKNGTGKKAK